MKNLEILEKGKKKQFQNTNKNVKDLGRFDGLTAHKQKQIVETSFAQYNLGKLKDK